MKTVGFVATAWVAAGLGTGMAIPLSSASWAAQPPPPSQASGIPASQGQAPDVPAAPFPAALTPPYPDTSDATAMGRWFGQTTHLPAKSILAVTDNAIFAAFPHHDSGPNWTVDVRLESITPQSTAKLGGRSIRLRLNVRCDNNTVRLSFLDVYPGADLTGAPTHRAPPNAWAMPKPNSYVADAVSLACDKAFKGPFAAMAEDAHPPRGEPRPPVVPTPASEASVRSLPASRHTVQIGAYSSAGASQAAWAALQADMPAATTGLSKVTTPVQIQGRTLYRTMVQGFSSQAAAATFCQTLRTAGRPCLVLGATKP